MDEPASAPPRRRIPRIRISLRAFMVLILILGTGLGYLVVGAREQRDAVAAIEHAGGKVAYDWQWQGGFADPSKRPWWPSWAGKILGPDYFSTVKQVTLIAQKPDVVDDDVMVEVGRLHGLESLMINGCKGVTDAGMVHVRGLSQLTILEVSFTGITGASLRNVAGFSRLKKLDRPTRHPPPTPTSLT